MAAVKKRTVNFTNDEKRILTELVLKYQNIVENKSTDATTNKDKLKGWMRLAVEFNNISTYCSRNHTMLKCCWENIKRQAKKKRAEVKKNIFMTGGGKPPTPPSNGESSSVVDAILGPALEGNDNIYDSDAVTGDYFVLENNSEDGTTLDLAGTSTDNEERSDAIFIEVEDYGSYGNNVETKKTSSQEDDHLVASTPKDKKTITLEGDNWTSWTPKDLKTPVSSALKVTKNNDDWLKRRRPKYDNASDILIKEKIELVQILKENALKESQIRLGILQEQLKQEKLKTEQEKLKTEKLTQE